MIYDRLRLLTTPNVRKWIKSRSWFVPASRTLFGNTVYSDSYNADIERIEQESVEHIAEWIAREIQPKRIIDIGCGPGHLMAALRRRGVETYGVDISQAAMKRVADKGLKGEIFDLTAPGTKLPGGPYDLAISCEVAEHLEAKYAATFVEKLCAAAPKIYLTAFEPGKAISPGLFHVNEQPNEYWIKLMNERGYQLDEISTRGARKFLDRQDVMSYLQRPMIFRRSG
jgi:SAM-dependent methyltransferase